MALFTKKLTDIGKQAAALAASDIDYSEFIPYYGHLTPDTLITKNGELMQIIRLTAGKHGLNYESGDSEGSVRDVIRSAVTGALTDHRHSVWIHTLRKRVPIDLKGVYAEPFAAHVHEAWQKKHRFNYSYYNEIYVSILHEGQPAPLADQRAGKHVIFGRANRDWRNRYIDAAHAELNAAVENVIGAIGEQYDAQRLSVAERPCDALPGQTLFYSEPLEFLGKLVNLEEQSILVPQGDLSTALLTHKLTFGYNAVESRKSSKQKRFGALLTLKQYREMPATAVDRILQAPIELIISEALHFTSNDEALAPYAQQMDLFDYSGDTYAIEASGLLDLLEHRRGRPTDFIKHQLSIAIVVDDYKHLDEEVTRAHAAFSALGLITVREDIKMEECFWAQLPGNFEFLRRVDIIPAARMAGFARLNLFTGGKAHGNHWSEAMDVIPTIASSPYFFNFHYQDNGHTLLCDFNSFDDQLGDIFLNYAITGTRKFQPRLFVFDQRRASQLTLKKLEGRYHTLSGARDLRGCERLQLNPFSLDDNPRNRGFLLAWCCLLIEHATPITDALREQLQQAIAELYTRAPDERNLAAFRAMVPPAIADALGDYVAGGRYAGIFDSEADSLDLRQGMHGFDMEQAAQSLPDATALLAYLLHRIILQLDGRPTLIVLHDCISWLENAFFAPRLSSLLEMLTQNNAMVIFHTQAPFEAAQTRSFAALAKGCATHLYLPDDVPQAYDHPLFGFSPEDIVLLSRLDRPKGDLLVKQQHEVTALRIEFDGMEDVRAIFANDIKTLISMGGKLATLPKGY